MTNNTTMQGVYVNVPAVDWSLFRELIRKFGWQAETREQLLDRIVAGLTPPHCMLPRGWKALLRIGSNNSSTQEMRSKKCLKFA